MMQQLRRKNNAQGNRRVNFIEASDEEETSVDDEEQIEWEEKAANSSKWKT